MCYLRRSVAIVFITKSFGMQNYLLWLGFNTRIAYPLIACV